MFIQYFPSLLCQMTVVEKSFNPKLLGKNIRQSPILSPQCQFYGKGTMLSQSLALFHQLFIRCLIGSSFPLPSKWARGSQFTRPPCGSNRTWTSWSASQCLPLRLCKNEASLIEAQYARCQCISVIYNMSNVQTQWRGLLSTTKPDGCKQWLEAINSIQH